MSKRTGIEYSVDTLPMEAGMVEDLESLVFGILGYQQEAGSSIRVMHSPADEDSAGRGWFRIESIKELPIHKIHTISRIMGYMVDNIEVKEF